MKKNAQAIAIAALIVLQIITLIRLGGIRQDLENTKSELTGLVSQVSGEIGTISGNVQSTLEQQASLLESCDYTMGDWDPVKKTVPVSFSITPKEVKEDTTISLTVAGETVAMVKNGAVFTAVMPVSVFKDWNAGVIISESGVQKTEKLEIWENLIEKVFPYLFCELDGESTFTPNGEGGGEYHRQGSLFMEITPTEGNSVSISRVSLVIAVDGKTKETKSIGDNAGDSFEINEKLILKPGQTATMTVIAADSAGLLHKKVVEQFKLDQNGEPVYDSYSFTDGFQITEKDGTVLYEPEY